MRFHVTISALVTAAAAVAVSATAVGTASAQPAAVVRPGQSIQAVLDAAAPYSTVTVRAGTYRENLLVTKPVTLLGIGAVTIRPPSALAANRCTNDTDSGLPEGQMLTVGICVTGVLGGPVDPAGDLPSVISPVPDVRVAGLHVDGFDVGVETDGTDGLVLSGLTLRDDADGIDTFYGTGTVLRNVSVSGATGFAAVSVQRSDRVRVTDCRFTDNAGFGLSLIDTWGGLIESNLMRRGAGGIAVLDTPAPGQAGGLRLTGNTITDNTALFPGDGSAPPVSGVGIALVGPTDTRVSGNTITGNTPTGDAPFSGFGIGLLDAQDITGGSAPSHDRITGNTISGSPLAVRYDGSGTDNIVRGNHVA